MAHSTKQTFKTMKKVFIFVSSDRDFELLTRAASHKEISRSAFMRQAMRREISRVLSRAGSEPERAEASS